MRALLMTLVLTTPAGLPGFAAEALATAQDAPPSITSLNAQAKAIYETDPAGSLALAERALAAARTAGDNRGAAEALLYVAFGRRGQNLLGLAKQAADESVQLFAALGDANGEAQGLTALGLIEDDDGHFAQGLDAHLKALKIREQTGDKEGLSYTYNNLGNAYLGLGEYAKALEYHQQGLALKIALGNKLSEAYSHHNIGQVYFAMGDYPKAREAYQRGLAIREAMGDARGIGVSLNAIGAVEAKTDPAKALNTYNRALALRQGTGDRRGEMATELNIGDVYQRMHQPALALAAIRRALAIGDQIDAPVMRSTALKALAGAEAAQGDYRAAFQHQQEYEKAHDEIFNRENTERLQQLQTAHDAESQRRQIEMLKTEGQLRQAELAHANATRAALAITVVLGAASLVLLLMRFRLKQQSEARFRAQAAELGAALARVQTLKGLLPICASCKKIRDDNGYWTQVEAYVSAHSDAEFTHSICPPCTELLYPEYALRQKQEQAQ